MAYLEMRHITKRFGPLAANTDVNLSVQKGHIHALLGENGAGKTTLMNILYGMYSQSEGEIWLDGEKANIHDSKDAIKLGIGMVHQHFMLIPTLSVIENVILGYHQISRFKLNLPAAVTRFNDIAEKLHMNVSPWDIIENLTIGQQQRIEILKALFRNVKLLILDEPTAVLTPQETQMLFVLLRHLTKEGLTIIFISHKLAEVMDICDHCTVLRQGRVVADLHISEIKNKEQLAALMVGRDVDLVTYKEPIRPGELVLGVKNLSYRDEQKVYRLNNVTFSVHRGEILGVCGVDGNGQSELVKCIAGLLPPEKGHVTIQGEDVTGKSPKDILKHKVAHIPEDRHKMGMIRDMTLNENLILMAYDRPEYGKHGFLNWKWISDHNEKIIQKYDIKTQGLLGQAGKLSGGNQQKLVVGRELDREPDLLIAMHPDRGLDIGATKYIQNRLIEERDRGAAVLLVSTELDEILELADRIIVLYRGVVMATLLQKQATRESLGMLMAGVRPNMEQPNI